MPSEYVGLFPPLPDLIRNAVQSWGETIVGWNFVKKNPEVGRWEPSGYRVITTESIYEFNLEGICYRAFTIFA